MITDQDTARVEQTQMKQVNNTGSQTVVLNPVDYSNEKTEVDVMNEGIVNREEVTQSVGETRQSDQSIENEQTIESANITDWFIKEGIKGNGDKPEFLLDKFKTVEDQLKSYVELEKRFGSFTGAPEDYALNISEDYGDIKIEADDPLLQEFATVAGDLNLNQEGFDKLLNTYVEFSSKEMKKSEAEQEAFQEQEIKKLGEDAEDQIKILNQWIENQVPSDMQDSIRNLATDASSVKAMQWLKDKFTSSTIPQTEHNEPSGLGTRLELREMMRDPKYGSDAIYTKIVDDGYRRLQSS